MPLIGVGVGLNRQRYGQFQNGYSSRVIADGGTIESLECVAAASSLLQSASLLLIPSGYKAGVAYAELPATGNGDLTWSRNSVANRTQSDGTIAQVAANVPRLSYMYGSCPALLLEPQRTNSIRNSSMVGAVAGSPGTLPTNWTSITSGLTFSVVGVGTENGLPYVDVRLNGTATGTGASLRFDANTQIVASNGQTWASSFWIKSISSTSPPLNYANTAIESTAAGGFVASNSQVLTITSTLTRNTFIRTIASATTERIINGIFFSLTNGAFYDFTIRIAAPQMELGAFATTWINTTNAAATRLVDTFSRNNIYTNGLISASGGTWYVELRNNVAYTRDASNNTVWIGDTNNGTSNSLVLRSDTTTSAIRLQIIKFIAGTQVSLFSTTTSTVKIAIKWNGTTADVFVNGTKQVSATAFTTTLMEFLAASGTQVPTFIQAMALYPTPLSDADCTALTT
jgi:hypothetical protein